MNFFSPFLIALTTGVTTFVVGSVSASVADKASSAPPPPPPLPVIQSLKLEPASLTLSDSRDERRVLVIGVAEGGKRIDLTALASFKTDSACVEIVESGYIRPRANGIAEILVKAADLEIKLPVKVESAVGHPVRFVREVQPILAKAGCNQGTCHGSAKGKNGFKLSLRGYDPEFDYQALINDLSGRRFNRVDRKSVV